MFFRITITILFLTLLTQNIFASQVKIDSLFYVLKSAEEDTNKVILLNELAWLYNRIQPRKAIEFGEKALNLAEKLDYQFGVARAYNRIGIGYLMKSNKNGAESFFKKAILVSEKAGDLTTLSGAYNNIGMIYHSYGEFEKAFEYYHKASKIAEKNNDLKNVSSHLSNLGELLKENRRYEKALEYYQRALSVARRIDYKLAISEVLNNIGAIMELQNKREDALIYYEEALAIKEEDNDKIGITILLCNIGGLYAEKEMYDTAFSYQQRAFNLAASMDYVQGVILSLKELADLHNKKGNYQKAINYATMALDKSEIRGEIDQIPVLKQILAKGYAGLGQYQKAYELYIDFKNINDSIYNNSKNQLISDLEIRYDSDRKEAENKLLKAQQAKQEAKIKQRTSSALAASLFFVLVSMIAVALFVNNRRKNAYNKLLKESVKARTEELEKSNHQLLRSNQELERFAHIASHDLKEPLRNISGFIKLLERRLGDKLDDNAREYIGFVTASAQQMHILIEAVLEFSKIKNQKFQKENVDLNKVLTEIKQTIDNTLKEKNVLLEYSKLPIVEAQHSHVFLLFKNLIENGIKYNDKLIPTIRISFIEEGDFYKFTVSDNGIGIDEAYYETIFEMFKRLHTRNEYAGTGLGLAICKKTVERFGGTISVESVVGNGCRFHFTLPKQKNDKAVYEKNMISFNDAIPA